MSPSRGTSPNDGEGMPSKLRHLVQANKPEIKICLHNPKTYTTLDWIEGIVTVKAPIDTSFDSIDIEFVGTSRTFVERMTSATAASGRAEAFHQFLKMAQPDMHERYPPGMVLKAGQIYEFPFFFTVPQRLLPRVCQHRVTSDVVREQHCGLPPTFGDKDLASLFPECLDDMAPDMASVRYGIFARVGEMKMRGDEPQRSTIASKARRIRVMPAADEHPPLDVRVEDGEYMMRKEKTIRKGMLKPKLGTLVMETHQPQSLRVQSYDSPECPTTMAKVQLRFDPADERATPPRLGSLSNKLKVTTYYSSTARRAIPTKAASTTDLSQGIHTEQLSLPSRSVSKVEWTRHEPTQSKTDMETASTRRDSMISISSETNLTALDPSSAHKPTLPHYTATLSLPITLPRHKSFVPTFHSCLISRIYTLKLDLTLHSTGVPNLSGGPNLELKCPIQISSSTVAQAQRRTGRGASAYDQAPAEAEIEDADDISNFFAPRRVVAPPEGGFSSGEEGGESRRASFDGGLRPRDREESPPQYLSFPPGYQGVPPEYETSGRTRVGGRSVAVF